MSTMEKDNQPHIRFSETPPGSPKSCMKGGKKLAFEENVEEISGEVPVPPRSPRKSTKVCIRSPNDNSSSVEAVEAPAPPPFQKPPDIQFSQHYDQSTPPPNCTSNGNYDFVQEGTSTDPTDPRNDPYLMDVASQFVNEIIEAAALEASNRQQPASIRKQSVASIARDILTTGRRSAWVQRAQGTVSKWFTTLCVKAQNSIRT